MEYTMFPAIPSTVPAQAAEDIGRAPAFDPETNTFLIKDGALVERSGRDAVRPHLPDGERDQNRRGPRPHRQQATDRPPKRRGGAPDP